MSGDGLPDEVAEALAIDFAIITDAQHDPNCSGGSECSSLCPIPVQVPLGRDDVARMIAPVVRRYGDQRAAEVREAVEAVLDGIESRDGSDGRPAEPPAWRRGVRHVRVKVRAALNTTQGGTP